ncbi:MAG: TraR/DksA family transcriptional regulator [Lentisphaeria bacterium]
MVKKKKVIIKSNFTDAQLAEFRDLLFAQRQSILQRIRHSSVHLESGHQAGDEGAEVGSDDFIRETGIQIMADDARKLEIISHALRNLENGTYGMCQDCEKQIGEARLKAKPYARLCLACKSLREKNGIIDS